MPKLNYDEIIALSEDPDVTAEDLDPGQPASPERYAELAEIGALLFLESSFEEQIPVVRCLPADNSAQLLVRMPVGDRNRILEQLPTRLAREITALLGVGVS